MTSYRILNIGNTGLPSPAYLVLEHEVDDVWQKYGEYRERVGVVAGEFFSTLRHVFGV